MGKVIVNTYPNKILKTRTNIKRNKKYSNNLEKTLLKRKHPTEDDTILPFKKAKINGNNAESKDEVIIKNGSLYYAQAKESDLFFDDELKESYFKNVLRDLYLNILEEISLEGLDGITTEGNILTN